MGSVALWQQPMLVRVLPPVRAGEARPSTWGGAIDLAVDQALTSMAGMDNQQGGSGVYGS